MTMLRACRLLMLAALTVAPPLWAAKPYDVLDLPAVQSKLAPTSLVFSLTRAGERFIATGIRGHILYSDDFGQSWTQAELVPVRSSLLDAAFPTPEQGWVVGHEAVILHTEDGGRTWVKQADGRELPKSALAYYEGKLAAEPDNERYSLLVDEMSLALESGADRPLFTVFMRDARTGVAAGAYGMLLRTTDAGRSWVPVMELMDLEQFVHIFDHAQLPGGGPPVELGGETTPGDLVASGEMGTVLALDPAAQRWRPQDLPYDGSMFTIIATGGEALVTGGLRGLVFHSADRGVTWLEATKPQSGAIVTSTLLADGTLVLGTQEGALLTSRDHGASFTLLEVVAPGPLSDIIEGRPGELIMSGSFGLHVTSLSTTAP
jgi:photosystem II stability/assembly factor-like uncharacterized protein